MFKPVIQQCKFQSINFKPIIWQCRFRPLLFIYVKYLSATFSNQNPPPKGSSRITWVGHSPPPCCNLQIRYTDSWEGEGVDCLQLQYTYLDTHIHTKQSMFGRCSVLLAMIWLCYGHSFSSRSADNAATFFIPIIWLVGIISSFWSDKPTMLLLRQTQNVNQYICCRFIELPSMMFRFADRIWWDRIGSGRILEDL
jgi:hypothetical protein